MPIARAIHCFSLRPLPQSGESALYYRDFNTGRRLSGHHLLGQFQRANCFIIVTANEYHPRLLHIHYLNISLRQLDQVQLSILRQHLPDQATHVASEHLRVRSISGEVVVTYKGVSWRLQIYPSPIRRFLNHCIHDSGMRPLKLIGTQWLRVAIAPEPSIQARRPRGPYLRDPPAV